MSLCYACFIYLCFLVVFFLFIFCSFLFPFHYLQEFCLFPICCVCNIFGDDIKLDYIHNVRNKEGHDSLLSFIIVCVLPYITNETQSFKRNNFQSYHSYMNTVCQGSAVSMQKFENPPRPSRNFIANNLVYSLLVIFFWL